MLTNNLKKYVKALHQRKYRQKYDKKLVEGSKSCAECLRYIPNEIDTIICTDAWWQIHSCDTSAEIRIVKAKEINSLSTLITNSQVLMVIPNDHSVTNTYTHQWGIYLDDVQDPGNVGTIIRIADWFGIPRVYLSPQSAQADNPKVIQSTMGSFLRVHTPKTTFVECKTDYQHILIADLGGKSLYEQQEIDGGLIVIGNEGRGPSQEVLKYASHIITIPGHGNAESLNASVSAGIICSWLTR